MLTLCTSWPLPKIGKPNTGSLRHRPHRLGRAL